MVGGVSFWQKNIPLPLRFHKEKTGATKVDRNRHKGCTMEKATKQGIRTAQLPLADYIAMGSYSRVLTARDPSGLLREWCEKSPQQSLKGGENF